MAKVTLKGNPVELDGKELKAGDKCPDFKLQAQDLSDVTLANSKGKIRIIATVPSLDTPVCQTETRRFNQEAGKLQNVEVLCVSTDLPFGQKRWCGAENISNVKALSDHRDASFGKSFGVLIKSGGLSRCLARAVFVVGPDDKIRHVEYVSEIAQEPNYEKALSAAKA